MRYFIDCEFDGYRGPLISMAMIREDGRSLYFVIAGAEDEAKDPWVITNVLPIIRDTPEAPYVFAWDRAGAYIAAFMDGDEAPHIVADWPDDLRHFCDLVVPGPGVMAPLIGFSCEVKRIDAYPTTLDQTHTGPVSVQHNAWWDALALRQKVLEMEATQGQPEPGAAPADGPEVGDVVALTSGGVAMTVTDSAADTAAIPPAVGVAWMTEAGEMLFATVPVGALRGVRRSA